MTISTQRLILIFLVTNMMIGMAFNMYIEPTNYSDDQIDIDETLSRSVQNTQNTKEGLFGSTIADVRRGYENTIGNTMGMGYQILKLFVAGLNPFSFSPNDFDTEAEQQFAKVIIWIRSILMILMFIEFYSYVKNKKSS